MSFILDGEKMRERLAQILKQAQEVETTDDNQRDTRQESGAAHTGALE